MKKILLVCSLPATALLLLGAASIGGYVLPATQDEVAAGVVGNKYVSPLTLAAAGLTGPTNGLTGTQVTNVLNNSTPFNPGNYGAGIWNYNGLHLSQSGGLGILQGDGFALYAGAAGTIYSADFEGNGAAVSNTISYFTNSSIVYVDVNGNNATAIRGMRDKPWRDLELANAACQSGDTIKLGTGTFNVTNTVKLKDNCTIIGDGPWATQIVMRGTNSNGSQRPCLAVATNNTVIMSLMITNQNANRYQTCIGNVDFASPFTNVVVRNCRLFSWSDAVYFNQSWANLYDSVDDASFYDCDIFSRWDVITFGDPDINTVGDMFNLNFYNCNVGGLGTNIISPTAPQYAFQLGTVNGDGTLPVHINLFGGKFFCDNGPNINMYSSAPTPVSFNAFGTSLESTNLGTGTGIATFTGQLHGGWFSNNVWQASP